MPKRFDLLIFDWDGTLADSTGLIVRAIQAAFTDVGLPPPSRKDANYVIGFGLFDAMQYLAPDVDDALIRQIVTAYQQHYLSRDAEIELFDGVISSLTRLKSEGFQLAVATGKSRRGLNRVLTQRGIEHLFEFTRCADESQSKPHPQMLFDIGERLNIEPTRSVMIGDTTHDLNMASNAKMAGLGVSYGAHPRDELVAVAPLAIFDSFAELDSWLIEHA